MSVDFDSDIHERLAAAEAALHAVGQQISPALRHIDIAVLIPCYSEAHAIGDVVKSFRAALPNARIFVYDNNSHDNTIAVARAEAGAIVRREPLQGKGHVVRRMFSDIEADVYVMVDGDATYDAASAPASSGASSKRKPTWSSARASPKRKPPTAPAIASATACSPASSRRSSATASAMLSGYRAFSRRFVKSFPALASGFETETELTVHALELDMITAE